MVRRATKKERKSYTKKRNNIILIATEGKNKTEKNYFQGFNKLLKGCNIIFSDGNNTDPVKIVKDAINTARNKDIESQQGDTIFAVFDTDFNKESQISEARKLAEKNDVGLILSNPCFEVWLLLHFRYSTRGYQSNHEVLNELCSLWPVYQKNLKSFQDLYGSLDTAVENATKLKHFHNDIENVLVEKCNPSTDVHKLIKQIIDIGSKS